MKKQFILVAMMFAATTAFAQSNEKSTATPAATQPHGKPIVQPAPAAPAQQAQTVDEKKVSAAHWMAAKRQLESAKDHLLKAKFDPGSQRENAIRSIEAAIREVNQALNVKDDMPKKNDDMKKHDHSDPNHKH